MAIGVLSLWLWCLVSVSVRSMTAHTAHMAHTQRVQGIGREYGEDVVMAGIVAQREERAEGREKKARVGRSDVTTPPPPLDE